VGMIESLLENFKFDLGTFVAMLQIYSYLKTHRPLKPMKFQKNDNLK
jgi:hypothetical protein